MVIDVRSLGEMLTDTLTGWMTAMFAVAALLLTATPFVRAGAARKSTLTGCVVFVLAGFAFLGIGTLKDFSGTSPSPSAVPPAQAANPGDTSASPVDGPNDDTSSSSGRSNDDSATTVGGQQREQYLSQLKVADWNHESGTGGYESGARDINGEQFGHSIAMNAGCQNSDGGDYWIDYTIGSGWTKLAGSVGLDGRSSTDSSGRWQILDALTGRELASGQLAAGPAQPFSVDVSAVSRVRLFISNPNSPNQMCGFVKIRTTLVGGDPVLTR